MPGQRHILIMSLNRTTLIGHLGKDAQIVNLATGSFVSFTLAVNQTYTAKDGEKKEKTEWFSCSYPHTKLADYLKKGQQVYLEGQIGKRAYLNKEGQAEAELTLWVSSLEFVGNKVNLNQTVES